MPSINSTEDLLNLLESNEEFRNAVRRWVLGDELLSMPDLMRRMDERLAAIESTQQQMAALLKQVVARLDASEARQDKLTTDLAILKGLSLQSQLHHVGLNAVVSRYRIRGARLVRAVGSGSSDTDFNDAVLDAMDNGLISDDDYTRLMATDMVVSGALAGTNVYVAVEASFTISSDDIDKVKRSAGLIKRVYPNIDARAALYYFAADDERRAAATDAGVEIIRAEIRPA